jgi:predicted RNA-binding Zn-ribbon protein involved in translation (DUF1610 family)
MQKLIWLGSHNQTETLIFEMNRREGDWNCPSCGDFQFGRNKNCRKCGKAKVGTDSADRSPLASLKTNVKKPGDWYCTECGTHQFASRLQCRSCGIERNVSIHISPKKIKSLFEQWSAERRLSEESNTSTSDPKESPSPSEQPPSPSEQPTSPSEQPLSQSEQLISQK